MDIHPRLGANYLSLTAWSHVGFSISVNLLVSSVQSLPADGLLLISDARLPECTIGLLQAESNSSLQVIFIIPRQVNYVYIKKIKTHRQV